VLDSGPANGSLNFNPDGTVTYTPNGDFNGSDSFTYLADDGTDGSNVATVSLTVNSVNDAPVAGDDAYSVDQDNPLTIAAPGVLGNDTDVEHDPLTAALVAGPSSGILNLASDGSFNYTPNAGFSGSDSFTYEANDGQAGSNVATVTITVNPIATGPAIDKGIATNVDNMGWTTVGNLDHSYTNMVVIATPNYDKNQVPLVTRIQNAGGDSFQVRVDRADGLTADIGDVNVRYMVLEAGVYTMADDGVKMEAVLVNSTVTDENNSWVGQNVGYQQSYTSPVVVGQVMTYNDPDWSTFWARGSSRSAAPSASALWVGKQVGEDPDATRTNETIGYVVVESGMGMIGDIGFEAGLGADSIKGVDDSPSYDYSLSGTLPSFSAAVASQAAMDGGNGGWAVLYGTDPASIHEIHLAIDEDRMKDSERKHTTEQVAYIVLDPSAEAAVATDQVLSQGMADPLEGFYWADFAASHDSQSKPKKDKATDLALMMLVE